MQTVILEYDCGCIVLYVELTRYRNLEIAMGFGGRGIIEVVVGSSGLPCCPLGVL